MMDREPTEAFVTRCSGLSPEDRVREFWKRAVRDLEGVDPRRVCITNPEILALFEKGLAEAREKAA